MSIASRHARVWAGLALAACAPLVAAQTIEIYAGGNFYQDAPGTSVQVTPHALTVGPDGLVYITDYNGRLLRFDPAQGTVTALPGIPAHANFDLGTPYGIAFDPAGELFVATGSSLHRIDIAGGTTPYVGELGQGGPMVYGPDGTLYYASADDHRVRARLPSGEVIVIAGQGESGFDGDGGPALLAHLNYPTSIALDAGGNLYVADTQNSRVRRIDAATGVITTIAGSGTWGYNGDNLPALETNLGFPQALAFDSAGNLYIAAESRILRLDTATGLITTVAGNGTYGFSGDGGPATVAQFSTPGSMAFDAAGNLYFQDGYRVRKVAAGTGIISTVIGNGEYIFCGEGVPARTACLSIAYGLDVDDAQNLLFTGDAINRVRQVSPYDGLVTTFANLPTNVSGRGLEHDAAGNVYVASFSNRVYHIDAVTHAVSTFAGSGQYAFGGDGGPASAARLAAPSDIAFDAAGNAYIADTANHRIRKVDAATGIISTYAGTFSSTGPTGDGGPATAASLNNPTIVEFDPAGNLVISDGLHCRLRRVDAATGIITTIAGNGTCTTGTEGDGGPATEARIGTYTAFAFDPAGNIYLAYSNRLRRIDATTGIINSVPTPPGGLRTPEGASIQMPTTMEFDAQGRLYVGDRLEFVVFRISGLPYMQPDSTPPVIEPHIAGTAGTNGWYTSDVALSWTVTDPESSVTSREGCSDTTVTQDTIGATFKCVATSAGGTSGQVVTIRRDATAPTLTFGAPSPEPNASGWYNVEVSVPFTVQDAMSGVASTSRASPVVLNEEGVGVRATVVVVDGAGNSAEFPTAAFNIDRTPPVVEPVINGVLGNNGWYRSDVAVSWSIGELPGSIQASSGCESSSVTSDSQGVTFTCGITSTGGTTSRSVTVKRDATAPVLTFGTPSPAPNTNGWNKPDVSIPFTTSDALSGVASTSVASPLVLSAEGANVTGQVVVTDDAGNSATFTSVPRNIDKTPPVVTLTSPADGATYGFYQDVVADYACADVSLLSCTAPTPAGELINTRTAGARTFKVTGKDLVNFTTSDTHSFTVESLFNFDGFLAPASAPPTLNLVSRGAIVPVRWTLPDGRGGFVSKPASFVSATVGSLSCGSAPVVPLNDTGTGPAGLSFDAATGTFTYNWATSASWTGCRKLTIKLRDYTLHELRFKFQ